MIWLRTIMQTFSSGRLLDSFIQFGPKISLALHWSRKVVASNSCWRGARIITPLSCRGARPLLDSVAFITLQNRDLITQSIFFFKGQCAGKQPLTKMWQIHTKRSFGIRKQIDGWINKIVYGLALSTTKRGRILKGWIFYYLWKWINVVQELSEQINGVYSKKFLLYHFELSGNVADHFIESFTPLNNIIIQIVILSEQDCFHSESF